MSYGEYFGTGTLTDNLARIAEDIRASRDNGQPTDQDMVDQCHMLMTGAYELWMRLSDEMKENDELTAYVTDGSAAHGGKVQCTNCRRQLSRTYLTGIGKGWNYCPKCGARFLGVEDK